MGRSTTGWLAGAALFALLLPAGLGWAKLWAQGEDPPSFGVMFPRYQYKERVRSLRQGDFRNLTLHLFNPGGRPWISERLVDGKFEQRTATLFDQVALESVHYFDFLDGEPQRALVMFYWISAGASLGCNAAVQLFEVVSGRLTVTQQIAYNCRVHGGAAFDTAARTLTIKATHYTASDPSCCPSKMDIVTFRWTGRRFEQKTLETVPIGSPDAGDSRSPG